MHKLLLISIAVLTAPSISRGFGVSAGYAF
jgi:hypothetical protein